MGKRDTDSDAREAVMKVTQALASTDYDVEDKDAMLKRSVESTVTTRDADHNRVTTDLRMPVTLATTSAEML